MCIEKYYEPIASRLTDSGISVRRRVVRILRDICVREPTSLLALDACRRLMSRVVDDDEVAKHVMKMFKSLWFELPPMVDVLTEEDAVARVEQLVSVVRGAPSHLDSLLRQLLVNFMEPADAERRGHLKYDHDLEDNKGASQKQGLPVRDADSITKVCETLVSHLIERLLKTGEAAQTSDVDAGAPPMKRENSSAEAALTLRVLSIFCQSNPSLVLRHIDLLPAYLEYTEHFASVPYVCDMLPPLLALSKHPSHLLLGKLERYLGALVFRVPEHLLHATARALCATVCCSRNSQLLHETLARLCQMMDRASQPAEATRLREQLYRSILLSGFFCRYFNFEDPEFAAETCTLYGDLFQFSGDVSRFVVAQVGRFVRSRVESDRGGSFGIQEALYAIKSIGHVCVRRTDLLTNWSSALTTAWGPSAPVQLKQQALASLHELLLSDPSADKDATPNDATADKIAHTSAVVTAVLQQHLKPILEAMSDPRYCGVRREALSLMQDMLRRGLVHPMACIPHIMALEVDSGSQGCASFARSVLRSAYERHPRMVGSAGILVKGMQLAYNLHCSLQRAVPNHSNSAPLSTPGYIFELQSTSRRDRIAFIRSMLGLLKPKELASSEFEPPATPPSFNRFESSPISSGSTTRSPLFTDGGVHCDEGLDTDASVQTDCGSGFTQWIVHAMAQLPYDREEEPLLAIHLIGRSISLHSDYILTAFARELKLGEAEPTVQNLVALAESCKSSSLESVGSAATMLCALLFLKVHLKQSYGLNDAKCRAFDYSALGANSTGRLATRIENVGQLDLKALRQFPPQAANKKSASSALLKKQTSQDKARPESTDDSQAELSFPQLMAAQYLWLKLLAENDDAEADYSPSGARPKLSAAETAAKSSLARRGRKRSSTTAKGGQCRRKVPMRGKKKDLATDDESETDPNDADWND